MQNINNFGNWVKHIVTQEITFQIPDYQRTFAWETQNIQTLLTDLKENKEYFLGLFLTETNEETKEYALIDGQQRFTTLYMLFHILNALYPEKLYFTAEENGSRTETALHDFIMYKDIFRLTLQHGQNRDFFQEMLRTPFGQKMADEVQYFSQEKLKKAYDLLYNELKTVSEEDAQQILQTISNSKILLHSAGNSGEAMQIFELLNDRGKQLTQLEALKSFIMHQVYILSQNDRRIQNTYRESIKSEFAKLYQCLNNINNISQRSFDEDDILRYGFIAFENWQNREEYTKTKDNLKKIFGTMSDCQEILTKTQKIVQTFQIMEFLMTEIHKGNCSYPWLKNLYIINRMASFYPLLISVQAHFPAILDKVCNYLELFAYRAYPLIDRRTDAGVATIYTLARDISFDKKITENKIYAQLKELINDYTGQEWAMERFKISLDDPMFYSSHPKDVRYLLIKYENYKQYEAAQTIGGHECRFINSISEITGYDGRNNKTLTAEHIIAQELATGAHNEQYIKAIVQGRGEANDCPTAWWSKEKRKYTKNLFAETFLHCLGNLVISQNGANSAKGCKPPKEKTWSSYLSQQEIKEQIGLNLKKRCNNHWRREYPFTVDEILVRKQKLIDFASTYWSETNVNNIDARLPLI
uniref:DUF262 domain-containing protein n=1 Tax=uncultured Alphaproteobacteria bacterium TaxID=91750 RepID=A0A6G8F247_9PROT|nr:hypothetical protein PlAlph_1140 [uncultured Alphaproteobacteria bacterium]